MPSSRITLPAPRVPSRLPGRFAVVITCLLLALAAAPAAAQDPPVAAFSPQPTVGCGLPTTVFFTDQSTGSGLTWQWDFGDGGSSTARNPIHSFTAPGNFLVALTVDNGFGSDQATETIRVSVLDAAFEAVSSLGCGPLEVTFTNGGSSTAGITDWSWDFGDGGNSSLADPSHVYTEPGVYDVTLAVEDLDGCSGSLTKSGLVTVTAIADLAISKTDGVDTAAPGGSLVWLGKVTGTVRGAPFVAPFVGER